MASLHEAGAMTQTTVLEEWVGGRVRRTPAVRLAGVTKSFGKVEAVRGIDLEIHPGEVVAFLGPNGAGKTTTIDMVLGLSKPTSGSVEVLADAGITGIADRKVAKCSGGEQQRLRFAMALLPDPALLLLDEPTTGMDVEGRRAFWNAIRQDSRRGRTVLFATHYLEEADQYADRIVLISQGSIVADGTGAEIKALASGRTVRATLPGADPATLAALAGVDRAEVRGDTVVLHASDSDLVARHLLTKTAAHDLEITAQGLEDAFINLTSTPLTSRQGATR